MGKEKSYSHLIVCFMIYLMAMITIVSRWVVEWLQFPTVVSKVATVAMYLPFLLFIVWKFICDLRTPQKDLFTIVYYALTLYCAALLVYRFLTEAEVKEGVYYSVILLGSIAAAAQLSRKKTKMTGKKIVDELCFLAAFILLYRSLFLLFFRKQLWYSPINEITLVAAMVLLLVVVCKRLHSAESSRFWKILCALLIFGLAAFLLTFGSRMGFFMLLVTIVSILVIYMRDRKTMFMTIASLLCAVCFVGVLFVLDVGEVRYAVSREMSISLPSSWLAPSKTQPSALMPSASPPVPETTTTPPDKKEESNAFADPLAKDQIERSDTMRKNLFQLSLEEVKKNPWFGTGNVLFTHAYSGKSGTVQAPAHNIILQTLNCYGIIGLFLIAFCIMALLIRIGLFHKNDRNTWQDKLLVLLVIVVFGGMSMVQATGYDVLVMPLVLIEIVSLASPLTDEQNMYVKEE